MILTCKRSSIHLYPLFILSAYGKFYPNITKNISNGELNWSCLAYFWWVLPCHTNFKNFRKFSLQWNNSFFFFFYLVFFISKSFLWFSPRSFSHSSFYSMALSSFIVLFYIFTHFLIPFLQYHPHLDSFSYSSSSLVTHHRQSPLVITLLSTSIVFTTRGLWFWL